MAVEELKKESNPDVIEEKARFIYEDYISILSPKEVSDEHSLHFATIDIYKVRVRQLTNTLFSNSVFILSSLYKNAFSGLSGEFRLSCSWYRQ